MQQVRAGVEELSESIRQENLDEIINTQRRSENAMSFEETMAEMRKQIAQHRRLICLIV